MTLFDVTYRPVVEHHLPDPARDKPGLVRADASTTSRAAADATWPRSGTARARVLAFVVARHGATDDEIVAGLDMSPNTARPRRVELVRDGWLEDSGEVRKTGCGQDATVWVLSGPGRMQWARHLAGAQ